MHAKTSQYTIYRPDGSIYERWNHVGNKPHYELSYWWWAYTMPPNAPLGTWKFVVAYESQSYETSFTISPPVYITITNPTGASEWLPGETHTITWQSTYSNNVKIDLYKGNLYSTTLTNTTPYETGFAWTIPLSPTLAPDYQIRVTDVVTPTIFGDSMYFSIGDLDKAYLSTILKE